jgi:hypothetical protein
MSIARQSTKEEIHHQNKDYKDCTIFLELLLKLSSSPPHGEGAGRNYPKKLFLKTGKK